MATIPRPRRWPRLGASLRALLERSTPGLLVLVCVMLLVLGKADVRLVHYLGERLTDTLVPVLGVIARPATGLRQLLDEAGWLLAAREENVRLRQENRELLRWQAEAARLQV